MTERPSVYRLTCAEMLRQVARSRQAPMKDQREMLERLAANIEAGGSAELERAVIDLGETVEASFKIMEATRRAVLSPIAPTRHRDLDRLVDSLTLAARQLRDAGDRPEYVNLKVEEIEAWRDSAISIRSFDALPPIARTEIADARAAFAVVWGWVSCGPKIAPDDVYEASGRVFKLLDSVLGAESTKETK